MGSTSGSDSSGSDGSNGATGPSGPSGPSGPVVAGPQGPAGHDGVSACAVRPLSTTFSARPFNALERQEITVLPYLSTMHNRLASHRHEIPTIQIGQASYYSGRMPYVINSQVEFAIDIAGLPPRAAIVQADQVQLKLNLIKISRDSYTDTEMLCLIDERICSGEQYTLATWKDNINPVFFQGTQPSNMAFASQYLDRVVGQVDSHKLYASQVTLELSDILARSSVEDPLKILYGANPEDKPLDHRTLHFVVTDDTYVDSAELVINLREDQCKTAELAHEK
jgi:hypothetical protein